MESRDKLILKIGCYYFDDIMRAWDRDIDTNFSGYLIRRKII